jgi:hypothetical protein
MKFEERDQTNKEETMAQPRTIDDFKTNDLLEAVDDLDTIRDILADGPNLEPPQLRIDLMKLHKLAMRVCKEGEDDSSELVELAIDIEDQFAEIRDASDHIIEVLREITEAETDEDETHDEEHVLDADS